MPEPKELVINTTPIISLIAATGALDMLPLLYSRVWVPFEVCQEIQGWCGWFCQCGICTNELVTQAR